MNFFSNFSKIFGKSSSSTFRLIQNGQPIFVGNDDEIYENYVIRAAIHAFAEHASKLKFRLNGDARPDLENHIGLHPNPFMNLPGFLYRCATILSVNNTLFVIPLFDTSGRITEYYPATPSFCEIVEHNGELYLKYSLDGGTVAAVEYDRVGIVSRFGYDSPFFGGSQEALKPVTSLINTQNRGLIKGIANGAVLRFLGKVDQSLKDKDIDKLREQFNKNLNLDNNGGIGVYDNTFEDVIQLKPENGTLNATQSKHIEGSVYKYFGVSESIVKNDFNDGQIEAFLNGKIMPFLPKIIAITGDVATAVVGGISNNTDVIVGGIVSLISELSSAITDLLPVIIEAGFKILMGIIHGIINALPEIAKSAVNIVATLVQGITDELPELIPTAISAIMMIVQGLIDNLPELLNAALQLITGLAVGLIDALPALIDELPKIIKGLLDFFVGSIPIITDAGFLLLTSLLDALPEIIDSISAVLPEIIYAITEAFVGQQFELAKAGFKMFVALVKELPNIIFKIIEAVGKINLAILEKTGILPEELIKVGRDLIKGLWQGISDAKDWLLGKIGDFLGGFVNSIKVFFGIRSPSTLFRDLFGKNMALGVGVGFVSEMQKVGKDMQNAIPTDFEVAPNIDTALPNLGVSMSKIKSDISASVEVNNRGTWDNQQEHAVGQLVTITTGMFGALKEMAGKMGYSIYLDTGELVGKLAPALDNELGSLRLMRAR